MIDARKAFNAQYDLPALPQRQNAFYLKMANGTVKKFATKSEAHYYNFNHCAATGTVYTKKQALAAKIIEDGA